MGAHLVKSQFFIRIPGRNIKSIGRFEKVSLQHQDHDWQSQAPKIKGMMMT